MLDQLRMARMLASGNLEDRQKGETMAILPVCTTTHFGKEGALQMLL
jgi:hypothetical protein